MKGTWAQNHQGRPYFFYRCTTHLRDRSTAQCRTVVPSLGRRVYVPAEDIEGLIWELVDEMLAQPEILAKAIGARLSEEEVLEPDHDKLVQRHEARLERAQKSWDTARRTYYAGELDQDTFERDKEYYERELAMLHEELERMSAAAAARRRQRATSE